MGWVVVRKDFTGKTSVECAFSEDRKHKKLTSGIAYVVMNEVGEERFAGQTCVKKVDNPDDIAIVPDFTSACFLLRNTTDRQNVGNKVADSQRSTKESTYSDSLIMQNATSYLLLRCKLLSDYKKLNVNDKMIQEIYSRYCATSNYKFKKREIGYLNACATNDKKYAKTSLKNLMCFHNCRTLIKMLSKLPNISRPDKRWLCETAKKLYKESYLLDDDIEQINLRLNAYQFSRLRIKTGFFYIPNHEALA